MDRHETSSADAVLPHHRTAAAVWDQGGSAYDDISFGLNDALGHAAQRLNARQGQAILDVATGTGWSARNASRNGARVTAVDISAELLKTAAALSAHIKPRIVFRLADAERLPFADASFNGAISTFGVIFAGNQEQAAAELGRVVKKGGRLSLAVWAPKGAALEIFAVIGKYIDTPPPPVSPLAWGEPDHARKLLGRDFALEFEPGVNHAYHDGVDDIWDRYVRGFGPIRALFESLDPARRAAFKRDIDAYHAHYAVPAGLHVKREYVVISGRRR